MGKSEKTRRRVPPSYRLFFFLADELCKYWDKQTSNGIAEGHYEKVNKRLKGKAAREYEVEHICYTVLKRAEYEHHYGEDYEQSLHRVVLLFVLVNRNEHTYTASDCEEEYADQIIVKLGFDDALNLLSELVVNARETQKECNKARSDKVAEPDFHKRSNIGKLVVKRIPHLARE